MQRYLIKCPEKTGLIKRLVLLTDVHWIEEGVHGNPLFD